MSLKIRNIIGIMLNLVLGFNFILSAFAKIPSMEVLGWTIAESTPFSWVLSEWLARIIIVIEITLGLFFIFQLYIKKITIPAAGMLIMLFSLYLFYVLAVYGNEANCGCYGEFIPLSTVQSLVKNGIILLILIAAYAFFYQLNYKYQKAVAVVLLVLSCIYPFYYSPPSSLIIFNKENTKGEIVPLHLISNYDNYLSDRKKIIAMVSPTCKYCKKAAKRMGIMKKRNPNIPFQLVMFGHKNHLPNFLAETRASNIPLIFMDSASHFASMNARDGVPTIKWLSDSTVIKTSTYFSLNEEEILKWLKN